LNKYVGKVFSLTKTASIIIPAGQKGLPFSNQQQSLKKLNLTFVVFI
jgi:hypothetical protein